MDNVCGIDRMKISVDALEAAHEYAHRLALRIFYDKRLGNNEYVPDTHKENLIEVSIDHKVNLKKWGRNNKHEL